MTQKTSVLPLPASRPYFRQQATVKGKELSKPVIVVVVFITRNYTTAIPELSQAWLAFIL